MHKRLLSLAFIASLGLTACGEQKSTPPAAPDDGTVTGTSTPAEGALAKALREKREAFMKDADPALMKTFQEAAQEIADSGVLARTRKVGDSAPEFKLAEPDGTEHTLGGLRSEGPVVLAFYRGKW